MTASQLQTATQPAAYPAAADARWAAVMARDADADGAFYYAVRSTGVYCRPSCPARRPKRENVSFHQSREAAEAAGFRACKRCRPDRPSLAAHHAAEVTAACRLIEAAATPPSLDQLAARVGLSPWHFHRVFKRVTGLTPRQYAAAHREARLRDTLGHGATVTNALLDAGYNASGRFYAQSESKLGMTPKRYRAGGPDTTIRFAVGQCSLGEILVAATARGVCAIFLGDDPDALARELQDRFPRADLVGGDEDFERLVAQVVAAADAPRSAWDLPLDIRGTAFQQRVWQALRAIPAGETASYRDIAQRIGAPDAVRAVAGACAANKIALAIPCHRVVRTDGSLSGYRWGVERKRALLDREARG